MQLLNKAGCSELGRLIGLGPSKASDKRKKTSKKLDLNDCLPDTDNFRTSAFMPSLAERFTVLRTCPDADAEVPDLPNFSYHSGDKDDPRALLRQGTGFFQSRKPVQSFNGMSKTLLNSSHRSSATFSRLQTQTTDLTTIDSASEYSSISDWDDKPFKIIATSSIERYKVNENTDNMKKMEDTSATVNSSQHSLLDTSGDVSVKEMFPRDVARDSPAHSAASRPRVTTISNHHGEQRRSSTDSGPKTPSDDRKQKQVLDREDKSFSPLTSPATSPGFSPPLPQKSTLRKVHDSDEPTSPQKLYSTTASPASTAPSQLQSYKSSGSPQSDQLSSPEKGPKSNRRMKTVSSTRRTDMESLSPLATSNNPANLGTMSSEKSAHSDGSTSKLYERKLASFERSLTQHWSPSRLRTQRYEDTAVRAPINEKITDLSRELNKALE